MSIQLYSVELNHMYFLHYVLFHEEKWINHDILKFCNTNNNR